MFNPTPHFQILFLKDISKTGEVKKQTAKWYFLEHYTSDYESEEKICNRRYVQISLW